MVLAIIQFRPLYPDLLRDRIAQLAEEHYPHEVASARIMFEATDLAKPHEWYPLARLRKRRIIYHGGIDAMDSRASLSPVCSNPRAAYPGRHLDSW